MQYDYTKTAEEFVHLYEKTRRLQRPMVLIDDLDKASTHMNHYRFYYAGNRYIDCYASTQNAMIEFGLRIVSERLRYSERNLSLAFELCHDLTVYFFAAKVLCCPEYDKGIIAFYVKYQSFVPPMPEDLDYMIDGVLILAEKVMDRIDDLIKQIQFEQKNKPNPPKHYE